jgi:hypothetical protein
VAVCDKIREFRDILISCVSVDNKQCQLYIILRDPVKSERKAVSLTEESMQVLEARVV